MKNRRKPACSLNTNFHYVVTSAISLILPLGISSGLAQSPRATGKTAEAYSVKSNANVSPFVGNWSYRSFRSNPDLSVPAGDLLFGAGELELTQPSTDRIKGTLGGEGWSLALKGGATHGNPATIRFQGKGTIGGEGWIYDDMGFLVPVWPNGIDQRPAIVRTAPHSGGQAKAGYVAQWIAVKQDIETLIWIPQD